MIIGITEYGDVQIYDDIDHVVNVWRGYLEDILNEVIIFYDEDGTWLEPIANYENGKWLKWRKKITEFNLKRNQGSDVHIDSLPYMLKFESFKLEKNKYFSSLEELRQKYPYEK